MACSQDGVAEEGKGKSDIFFPALFPVKGKKRASSVKIPGDSV